MLLDQPFGLIFQFVWDFIGIPRGPGSLVRTLLIIAFMAYHYGSSMSPANMTNYMTVIRSMCNIYGRDTIFMRDQRMFVKAIGITRKFNPSLQINFDENILQDIIKVTQHMQHPIGFQNLYLLCFFYFQRLSNILPHTAKTMICQEN